MKHPDISKAVQTVAQFASNPGKHHWYAVVHIVHYLRTTRDWVLTLGRKSTSVKLLGYWDADHANSPNHGCSISGYAMVLGNGCFSWSSKKQTATALSTGVMDIVYTTHTLLIHFITTRTFDMKSLYHYTYFLISLTNRVLPFKAQKLLSYLPCSIYYIFCYIRVKGQRSRTCKSWALEPLLEYLPKKASTLKVFQASKDSA